MTVRLSRQVAFVTGWALPPWSAGPATYDELFPAIVDAGYEGVQLVLPVQAEPARQAGLTRVTGLGPARSVDEVDAAVEQWAAVGAESLTLHLGSGFETPDGATALVEAALAAAGGADLPLLVETHRATLFQDPARALALAEAFPQLRFCADLSHWYTGVEMVYGDLEAKLAALAPVLARCRMVHGRISDPGCIQVAVVDDDPGEHVGHFRRMWASVIAGCDDDPEVDELPFVVELLPAGAHYARTVDRGDGPEEEVDRWTQADVLWRTFSGLVA